MIDGFQPFSHLRNYGTPRRVWYTFRLVAGADCPPYAAVNSRRPSFRSPENAAPENDGPNCGGGKWRTWKITDQLTAGCGNARPAEWQTEFEW